VLSGTNASRLGLDDALSHTRKGDTLVVRRLDCLGRSLSHLLEYRLAAGPAFEDQGIVFPNSTGGPLHPNSLANRFRRPILRAGAPPIRFHDLRHTCATLLLSQGAHPKIVQERLGHADIAMTMNLYSHDTPDMQRDAADQLDAMISVAAARLA
jgi:integrase